MVLDWRMLPLLLTLAACKGAEATGITSQPMTVTFEPAEVNLTGTRLENGLFRCPIDMTILAHGKGDYRVRLLSITSTFYDSMGTKTSTISSLPSDWFGVTTLKRDEQAIAHRLPTGSDPFTLASALTYVDQFGTSQVATFTLKCAA